MVDLMVWGMGRVVLGSWVWVVRVASSWFLVLCTELGVNCFAGIRVLDSWEVGLC